MNLNQLEHFCTAVECGSITRAAKKLFVTQPAISGAIRAPAGRFLVMYNTDSVQNYVIRNRFDALGIAPDILIYTSQIHTIKSMIHSGACVSFFYASLLQDHPDIVGVPIEPRIEQKVGLIWHKGKYTPAGVEAFISFVRDYPLFPEEP